MQTREYGIIGCCLTYIHQQAKDCEPSLVSRFHHFCRSPPCPGGKRKTILQQESKEEKVEKFKTLSLTGRGWSLGVVWAFNFNGFPKYKTSENMESS